MRGEGEPLLESRPAGSAVPLRRTLAWREATLRGEGLMLAARLPRLDLRMSGSRKAAGASKREEPCVRVRACVRA